MKQVPYRLAEALERICSRKVLENITVSEIAMEAGVTRQVFYHHFNDKFELASWIHFADLYQAMKRGLGEKGQYSWCRSTTEWLRLLMENKNFYTNAFQSTSQKEFQRVIRNYFNECYKGMLECIQKKPLTEAQVFVIDFYCIASLEKIYQWIHKGMQTPVEKMMEYLELSMPEPIRGLLVPVNDVPCDKMLKAMEIYLSEHGLLQSIS